jgi:CxxC motif-containing protein (DUF1111 family)
MAHAAYYRQKNSCRAPTKLVYTHPNLGSNIEKSQTEPTTRLNCFVGGAMQKQLEATSLAFAPLLALVSSAIILGQSLAIDPGPRQGAAGAGGFYTNLTSEAQAIETDITAAFTRVNTVSGTSGGGLGPRFNSNSCAACHAQPAIGGSSPASNPLFSVYQAGGATNTMPSFITASGPVLNARFPFQSDLKTPDGQVHQLFVITGRSDAAGCSISQPNFTIAAAINNLVFRQPTPVFGAGLIDVILDSDIRANQGANLTQKQSLGITGHPNTVLNDGSISRFGWKAQVKSLKIMAALEEQVQKGVTNEFFPTELDETPGCTLNPTPEDSSAYTNSVKPDQFPGDPERQALFMRFLDRPTPAPSTSSTKNGETQFNNIGCVLCHTKTFKTPSTNLSSLSKVNANLYSDLLVHHVGPCLADGIGQGTAQGDEFRTAPLWGAGQRVFFLHDGRTSDIVRAIESHFCLANSQYPASEANAVLTAFNALSATNQQDIVNFLRSL